MNIFAFGNCKGGVGKTSIALLWCLGCKGKTLFIDTDIQANATKMLLETFGVKEDYRSIQQANFSIIELSENLHLIPSKFAKVQRTIDFSFLRKLNYDNVIIDTRPEWSQTIANAYSIATNVELVFTDDPVSISGALTQYQLIKDKTKVYGIMNRVVGETRIRPKLPFPYMIVKEQKRIRDYAVKGLPLRYDQWDRKAIKDVRNSSNTRG